MLYFINSRYLRADRIAKHSILYMTAVKYGEDPIGMGKNACKMKNYFVFSSIFIYYF